MNPVISVLVPVRNEGDDLIECLASLARQSIPLENVEILIADGSDEAIPREILAAYPGSLSVVPNPARLMTVGLNLIAARAGGAYLAIVSAHSAVPPDYLRDALGAIEATGAANIGGRIVKVARSSWGRAIAAATSSPLAVGDAIQHYGTRPRPTDSAFPGFIERRAFDAIGGFDERLACNEDDEFNARLRASGRAVWYEPRLVVTYRPRERMSALFAQYYRYGRWKLAIARLGRRGYLRWRHLVPSATVVLAASVPLSILFVPPLGVLLALLGVVYVALAALEGLRMARRFDASPWKTALVFPVVHAAYGIGFLRGLIDRGLPVERAISRTVVSKP